MALRRAAWLALVKFSMDLVIRLRSAVALAGRFPVLAGVDLEVPRGDIVLLQGANGAGKTSILRACAGLLPIAAGEAWVLGVDMLERPSAVRPRIGLLGHASGLYDDLSVEENVSFAVRAARGDRKAVGPALERVGLGGRLRHTAVNALSAGQRRRVALATLVARRPELWLLDEPHAGLDAEHRDILDALVREAVQGGATVLMASHERERASALAARSVIVAGGVVAVAAGTMPASESWAPTGLPGAAAGPLPASETTANQTAPEGEVTRVA